MIYVEISNGLGPGALECHFLVLDLAHGLLERSNWFREPGTSSMTTSEPRHYSEISFSGKADKLGVSGTGKAVRGSRGIAKGASDLSAENGHPFQISRAPGIILGR